MNESAQKPKTLNEIEKEFIKDLRTDRDFMNSTNSMFNPLLG